MKPKVHASKKSMLLLLTLLLGSSVYAQETQLRIVYESQQGMRLARVNSLDITIYEISDLQDADGDGVADLIMKTLDAQGNLQDLLVVAVNEARPRQEIWRVDNVPDLFGCYPVDFHGFAAVFSRDVHGIFTCNLGVFLVDPRDNALSWADDNGVPAELGAVLDLTQDGFADLVFFLPDTKQVRVWSIDH